MAKLNWLPTGVKFDEIRNELGFLNKKSNVPQQLVLSATAYDSGYTKLVLLKDELMASIGTLKAAGMPEEVEEGKVELSVNKGVITLYLVN